ncbi:MAG TPA: Rrf2 family transcriptional regulator [Candidatus Eisenbacteria bacterium]|nr:Rrf2 family transcriptional regulator [Candidatus Eisenbacteria bacterium]
MRLGSKTHYGILALAELASNYKSRRPLQVKEIAASQRIPPEYLGQIMVLLNRARLVHGARGPGGGYVLARAPEHITLREAIEVLEGPLAGFDTRLRRSGGRIALATQKLIEAWARGIAAMEKALEETTLADLCATEEPAYMYYI